jgi:hypothetical protein
MRAAIMLRLAFALASLPMADALAAPPPCWPNVTLPISVEMARSPTTVEYGDVVYSASQIGVVWGYSCKASDGLYYKVIAAGAWDVMPRDWLYIADTLLRGTDADRAAAWNKYVTAAQWDARLKSDLDMVWAQLPGPPPTPPVSVWRVLADPFRSDKKRLIYTVVGGKRGPATSPPQYIDAGAPCDPITTITEFGSTIFMSVLGNPALIARCVKQ